MVFRKRLFKGVFLFIATIVLVFVSLFNPFTARVTASRFAGKYNLDREIFVRQIRAESSYRFFVVSEKGAIGLGQVMLTTAQYIDPAIKRWQLFLPWINLDISAQYMRYLLGRFNNNYSLALAAYNWGETNVENLLKAQEIAVETDADYQHLFVNVRETFAYLGKILGE